MNTTMIDTLLAKFDDEYEVELALQYTDAYQETVYTFVKTIHPLQMFGMDQRSDFGGEITRVILLEFCGSFDHARHHLFGNRFLHQQARPCQTNLSRIVVLFDHVCQRQILIGIFKDDQR